MLVMKSIKYKVSILLSTLLISSCSNFLDEKPLDFYSPENSMITVEHFQSSLNYLYNRVRFQTFSMDPDTRLALYYATDFAHNSTDYYKPAKLNDFRATMVPTFSVPQTIWTEAYKIISNSNIIINRIKQTDQVDDATKLVIEGEAKFFRAYAYRELAHLFGGVPIELNEVTVPRRDYVRDTRENVYKQIKSDLEDAVKVLPNIEDVKDGKVSKQLAYHYLSEIYICLGMYDDAITAASNVINHPGMGLMKERFGSRKSEEGDVYWDLFRLDNQNRKSGNTESLWVLQYDYMNSGSETGFQLSRFANPFYENIVITAKDEKTGEDIKTTAFLGVSDGKSGRSIGWFQPTKHFFEDIWAKGSENDIRNSKYNIIRDVIIDNPASPAYGKWFVADGYVEQVDSIRQWYPIITKYYRIKNYPQEFWKKDANGNPIMNDFGEHLLLTNANDSYKDEYLVRLAETYLLRAEAYVMKGEKKNAVKDINEIRARAKANPADESEIDIDYILDERLRELYGEEMRMLTLCRMGKLVERNRKYNPATGKTIDDYHNLWPIPFSEIERNTGAKIEQNPGY